MKSTLVLVLSGSLGAAALAAPLPPSSKAASSKPAGPEGRFLFVVDTSTSMESIGPAVSQTVFDLVSNGINGYMRNGDTFGIWTFDEELGTGKFPMQVWDGQAPLPGARRAAAFVRDQEFKGQNRMKELMLGLSAVLRAVSNVNVLLISDGEARIRGTPMDREINAAYSQRSKERKNARKPFITTFVAEGGRFTHGIVTLPGEPIRLPPRPALLTESAKTVTPGVTNASPASAPAAPVVSSSAEDATLRAKESIAQVEPSAPPPTALKPEASRNPLSAPAPDSTLLQTSSPIPQTESHAETSDSPLSASEGTVVPSESGSDLHNASIVSTATEAPPAAPKRKVMQIITRPSTPPADPETAKQIGLSHETNGAAQPEVAAATAPTPAVEAVVPPVKPAPEVSVSSSLSNESTSATAAKAAKPELSAGASKFVIVAAREPGSPISTPGNARPASGRPSARPGLGAFPTLIIGGILLAMSLFLLGVALRRTRHEGQGSLITQSMHRR